MKAMVLEEIGKPLQMKDVPIPNPKEDEHLIRVLACGVCRTDQHIIDGEIVTKKLPLIPGHQIVGIDETTKKLVGVAWLAKTCGSCAYCIEEQENLCDHALFTGYDLNGGYAEYVVAHKDFIYPLSDSYSPIETAPLLCSGMLGYRAYKMLGEAKRVGFYGFGAAAHILIQIAKAQGKEVFVFTRQDDVEAASLAKNLGATWVGSSLEGSPTPLDAAIIFASDGKLVPQALKNVKKGGVVICAGIHMSDIPSFPYEILWGERTLKSVANLKRQDAEEFLALIEHIPLKLQITTYALEDTNKAISDLRDGHLTGAAVILINAKE